MSAPSSESIIATQKAALDAYQAALGIAFGNIEKLASLQLSTVREALLSQIESAHSLIGVKDLHEAYALQSSLAQPQIEKGLSYFRGLYDITASSQEEFGKLVELRQAEFNKSVGLVLDWVTKSPGNSEVAIAAVKSAVSAANSAFENANKAARQVADITEASVKAATSATVRAVGAATPARSKKAA